jgi:hypothetical protein
MTNIRIDTIRFTEPDLPELAEVSFIFIDNGASFIGGRFIFQIHSKWTMTDIKTECLRIFKMQMDIKE